ncbi:MAG: hypothetical protein ACWGN1_04415, partial [Desulfobulbales bacterium]
NLYTSRLTLLRVQSEQLSQRVNLHLALGGSFGERASTEEHTEGKTTAQEPGQPAVAQLNTGQGTASDD